MVERKFDWGDGTVITVSSPREVLPHCGGRNNRAYDPLEDCNLTNRIYELSLSYARERGESLPSADDSARALQKILPGR